MVTIVFVAVAGPAFDATIVKLVDIPSRTVVFPEIVTETSAWFGSAIVVLALAELLVLSGSAANAGEVSTSVTTVPGAVPAFVFNTIVTVEVAFAAKPAASVQLKLPVPPPGGTPEQTQAPGVIETNVVFGGVLSLIVNAAEAAGPLFAIFWV
jgi:hypothetical protein